MREALLAQQREEQRQRELAEQQQREAAAAQAAAAAAQAAAAASVRRPVSGRAPAPEPPPPAAPRPSRRRPEPPLPAAPAPEPAGVGAGRRRAPPPPPPPPRSGIICPVAGSSAYSDTWGAGPLGRPLATRASTCWPAPARRSSPSSPAACSSSRTASAATPCGWPGRDGNRYYYAHLSSFEGSSRGVSQGEVIGYVGDTGNARGHAAPALRGAPRRRGRRQPVPVGAGRRLLSVTGALAAS